MNVFRLLLETPKEKPNTTPLPKYVAVDVAVYSLCATVLLLCVFLYLKK